MMKLLEYEVSGCDDLLSYSSDGDYHWVDYGVMSADYTASSEGFVVDTVPCWEKSSRGDGYLGNSGVSHLDLDPLAVQIRGI